MATQNIKKYKLYKKKDNSNGKYLKRKIIMTSNEDWKKRFEGIAPKVLWVFLGRFWV